MKLRLPQLQGQLEKTLKGVEVQLLGRSHDSILSLGSPVTSSIWWQRAKNLTTFSCWLKTSRPFYLH